MSTAQKLLTFAAPKRQFAATLDSSLAILWLRDRVRNYQHIDHAVACDAWLLIDGDPDFQQSDVAERVMTWLEAQQQSTDQDAQLCARKLLAMAMEAVAS